MQERIELDKINKIEYIIYCSVAALAQSVERRLGKAEVGGSSPLGSFKI